MVHTSSVILAALTLSVASTLAAPIVREFNELDARMDTRLFARGCLSRCFGHGGHGAASPSEQPADASLHSQASGHPHDTMAQLHRIMGINPIQTSSPPTSGGSSARVRSAGVASPVAAVAASEPPPDNPAAFYERVREVAMRRPPTAQHPSTTSSPPASQPQLGPQVATSDFYRQASLDAIRLRGPQVSTSEFYRQASLNVIRESDAGARRGASQSMSGSES